MHRPTEQTRAIIEAMTINGVPQADIAAALKIDPKTLRKFYKPELSHATIMLCARVARHLGKIATTGRGAAAVSACRYILGCKAGWKDTTHIAVEPSIEAGDYAPGQSPREIILAANSSSRIRPLENMS